MLPLWDMMAKAQNGQASELIARQFALSQAQVQAAVDALLPAFSQALKRKAADDPFGLGAFMAPAAGGAYAKYFEDVSRAFTPEGVTAGNAVLGQIFGSKELSRAVAAQAAQATGVGAEIMKQMLPALAAMMTGGFFKQFAGALPQAGANPFADFFAAMAKQGGTAPAEAPPADAFAQAWAANPWSKAFSEMWSPAGKRGEGGAATTNPFGRMFEPWTGAGQAAPPEAKPGAANPYGEALAQMFETGRKTRDDYLRATDALFDQFTKAGKPG